MGEKNILQKEETFLVYRNLRGQDKEWVTLLQEYKMEREREMKVMTPMSNLGNGREDGGRREISRTGGEDCIIGEYGRVWGDYELRSTLRRESAKATSVYCMGKWNGKVW